MYAAGHAYNLMSPTELETIHRQALHILAEMGMEIQNRQLLEVMGDFGLIVDLEAERVRFPASFVERFLDEAEKHDWATAAASGGWVGWRLPRSLSRSGLQRTGAVDRGAVGLLLSAGSPLGPH